MCPSIKTVIICALISIKLALPTNALQATRNCYYSCTALIPLQQSLPAVKRVFLYGNAVFLEE
jgi:hypothetical protein